MKKIKINKITNKTNKALGVVMAVMLTSACSSTVDKINNATKGKDFSNNPIERNVKKFNSMLDALMGKKESAVATPVANNATVANATDSNSTNANSITDSKPKQAVDISKTPSTIYEYPVDNEYGRRGNLIREELSNRLIYKLGFSSNYNHNKTVLFYEAIISVNKETNKFNPKHLKELNIQLQKICQKEENTTYMQIAKYPSKSEQLRSELFAEDVGSYIGYFACVRDNIKLWTNAVVVDFYQNQTAAKVIVEPIGYSEKLLFMIKQEAKLKQN